MDYLAKLRYGTEEIELPIRGAKSVTVLNPDPMPEIENLEEAFRSSVEENVIGCAPLKQLICSQDQVTIVVSDITRSWMHQGDILTLLGKYLHEKLGVELKNITVLIALGTHRFSSEEEKRIIAGTYLYENSTVVDHDCDGVCTEIGVTSRGTHVQVNPLAIGRKTIIVGGTVHHMMAGFGGGRKNILPGISSRTTIRQNHERALDPKRSHSDLRVGCGLLEDNPIHEDMEEAAELLNPVFSIHIVVSAGGKHSGLFSGKLKDAWLASCDYQRHCYEKWIDEEADMVIVSSGGAPKDMNLYQGCKGMMNGMRAMKEGGEMLWLARCPEGCGAPDYTSWLVPLKEGRLDEALRADFTIGGFIFYLTVENLQKGKCRLLSVIDAETVAAMGMIPCSDTKQLLDGIDFCGKTVYVIPYGGSIVPMLKENNKE